MYFLQASYGSVRFRIWKHVYVEGVAHCAIHFFGASYRPVRAPSSPAYESAMNVNVLLTAPCSHAYTTHTHTHTHMHTHTHTHTRTQHLHTLEHTLEHTCTHTCTHLHTHLHTHTHTHMHTHTCTHAHTHMHTHTHTHVHITIPMTATKLSSPNTPLLSSTILSIHSA